MDESLNEKAKILVVDDDATLRRIAQRVLVRAGYEVLEAGTGSEGLRLAVEDAPDIAVLDVVLPDMDGLDLCRRIKESENRGATHVLMLSGHKIDSESQAAGLEAGADDYVTRPVSRRELLARVRTLLRLKRTRDALRREVAERRRLEREASERKEYLEAVLAAVPDAIVTLDREHRIIDWNRQAEALFGYRADEVSGRPIDRVVAGTEDEVFEEARGLSERVAAGETVRVPEAVRFTKAGEPIDVRLAGAPIVVDDERVGAVGVYTDVGDRRRTEERLRESERRFRRIIENAPLGYYRVGRDMTWQYVNRAWEEMHGYTQNEVVGRSFRLTQPQEDVQEARRILEDALSGETIHGEFARQRKDGTTRFHAFSLQPVYEGGDIVAAEGFIRDTTERRRMENALRESEEQYRSLFNSIRDAILVADTDRDIVDCNPAFTDLFGYTLEEIAGKRTHVVYRDMDEFKRLGQALQDHIGDPSFLFTVHYQKKSGAVFPGETNVFYLRDDEGNVVGFIGLIRDVTERQRMEEALEAYSDHLEEMVERRTRELHHAQEKLLRRQKLATLGQLAGSINHELRGPLGNIKNGAYFLGMALTDADDDVVETVDLLAKEVDRAESIVNTLLAFARTEEPTRHPVDVQALITEVLEDMGIPEPIDVVRRADDPLPTVSADPEQLRQVFRNLIVNGIQAMSDGGRLAIKMTVVHPEDAESEEKLLVSVSDTGEGIPGELRDRIFEPLVSTRAEGVGLGLALARMLVDSHGGRIDVESAPGKGSTFMVRLPVER